MQLDTWLPASDQSAKLEANMQMGGFCHCSPSPMNSVSQIVTRHTPVGSTQVHWDARTRGFETVFQGCSNMSGGPNSSTEGHLASAGKLRESYSQKPQREQMLSVVSVTPPCPGD